MAGSVHTRGRADGRCGATGLLLASPQRRDSLVPDTRGTPLRFLARDQRPRSARKRSHIVQTPRLQLLLAHFHHRRGVAWPAEPFNCLFQRPPSDP
jgi:hypothetical protein